LKNNYETSDIGLSAYLMLKGAKLLSVDKGTYGYKIVFDNSNGSCTQHSLDYVNSEFLRYDMYSKNLRVLLKNK